MPSYYIRQKDYIKDEIEKNFISSEIKEAFDNFQNAGYPYYYACFILRKMMPFGDWLKKSHISLKKVDFSLIDDYIDSLPSSFFDKSWKEGKLRQAAHLAIKMLQIKYPQKRTVIELEIDRYSEHLRQNCGYYGKGIKESARRIQNFLLYFFAKKKLMVRSLTPLDIANYIKNIPSTPQNFRAKKICTALRGYFRFLQIYDGTKTDHLIAAIPSFFFSRRSPPRHLLSSATLNEFLNAIDRCTSHGKRTYATVLCLSELGMRIGDVTHISLDDINWREGTILVRNSKSAAPFQLPLPKKTGEALVDYIRNARPTSESRQVFLGLCSHPKGLPASAVSLGLAVKYQWNKSCMSGTYPGTYVFRHGVATNLTQKGFPLKVIADVLGHRSIKTTRLYTQVDIPALNRVAQPWPQSET